MSIATKIIEKLKLKELFGMLFISAIIISLLPTDILKYLKIYDFKLKYQTYVSGVIIIIGSYYLFNIIKFILLELVQIIFSPKRIAIKYLKKGITADEIALLIITYYDSINKKFKSTGIIDIADGRKAALIHRKIIYLASNVSVRYSSFAYNLQPYVTKILNENLEKGNIVISENQVSFHIE